jgi:hypothetical protein
LPTYNLYIEIKGREIGPIHEKCKAVEDSGNNIKLLYKEDLKNCFTYIHNKYGINSYKAHEIATLYDKDK